MAIVPIVDTEAQATLEIEFLFLDLTTCSRCLGADRSLASALTVVGEVLAASGVEVEVTKVLVDSEEQARALRFRELADDSRRWPGCRAGAAGELVRIGGLHRRLRRANRLPGVGPPRPGVHRTAGRDDRRCDPGSRLRRRSGERRPRPEALRAAGEPCALLRRTHRSGRVRAQRLLLAQRAGVVLRRRRQADCCGTASTERCGCR